MRDDRRSEQRGLLDTLALVLAGGCGSRLAGLTDTRAKPAVPFGSQYRIVDFTLSNCVNSGVRHIALLTQYKSQSLIRHLQQHWPPGSRRSESIEIWPAQQRQGARWYVGTADAVYQNKDLIAALDPEHVLILAGDHVYAMDYAPMIAEHAARGADVTVSCIDVPVGEAREYGIVEADASMRILGFTEKPERPRPLPGRRGAALASMGIYVFRTEFLLDCLARDAGDAGSRHDFGYSILPRIIEEASVHAHVFDASSCGTGYWRDVGTLDSYWLAHMDLLSVPTKLDLNNPRWPIWGGPRRSAPAQLTPTAEVAGAMLGSGCLVAGQVHRSVLSADCRVAARSVVKESVLLPSVTVGRNCVLERVVIDSRCSIPDGTVIDGSLLGSAHRYHVSPRGVVLVTESPEPAQVPVPLDNVAFG